MKKTIYISLALVAALILFTSCNKVLDEQPRTSFEPDYLKTEAGVKGGITALYASLRYVYGQGDFYNSMELGTDEATWGQYPDDNIRAADYMVKGLLSPSHTGVDVLWNTAFPSINLANAIIENGGDGGLKMDKSLIAEAYFFRGFYYFQLVQIFGGVPLDLGGGELHSNFEPIYTSQRNIVPEVYEKSIFPDLERAVEMLPDSPRLTGTATKNVALLVLAKAYLTYGWWLENPNGIPTYPECDREPSYAKNYFQKAFDTSNKVINEPGPYGLCETYFEVNRAANDRNKEIMLYADHTDKNIMYNGEDFGYGSCSSPENVAGRMMNWNYGMISIDGVRCVTREVWQELGSPLACIAPTHDAYIKFTNVEQDSRWEGTFTTEYYTNWTLSASSHYVTSVSRPDGGIFKPGEKCLSFLADDYGEKDAVKYPESPADGANIGAGTHPRYSEYVFNTDGISRVVFPGLWKLGPYSVAEKDLLVLESGERTARYLQEIGDVDAASTRPFPILKFSELYLIAAEAAVKVGNNDAARKILLPLRERAGRWRYKSKGREGEGPIFVDFSAEMAAATPQTITIDYILDERLREFYGEGVRRLDLIRTQKLNERADAYFISVIPGTDISSWGAHEKCKFPRSIEKYQYLSPIPQSQIDGLNMSDEEKAAYQNPSY